MDKVLLDKYFNGEACTPDELLRIKATLEETRIAEPFLYQEWKTSGGVMDPGESEAIWADIVNAIPKNTKKPSWIRLRKALAAAAAIAAIAIGISFLLNRQASPVAWRTVDNPSRDVKLVRLEDGSQIWLNAHSSLSISEQYQQKGREVRLSGEAFFDIARDAKQAFVVYAGNLRTTVLGTTFDIRAWPSLTSIQIALVSGKVRVDCTGGGASSYAADSLILAPGDKVDFDTADRQMAVQHNAVREDFSGWTNGKIVLDNTSLPDIFRQLEQIYHVKFSYAINNAGSIRLSGQFRREPIDQVLKNLLFPIDLAYTYENGVYFIHQTKDNKRPAAMPRAEQ